MKRTIGKKISSVMILMAILVTLFSGCKKEETSVAVGSEFDNLIDFNEYKDSEEIPDWEGQHKKLIVWARASETQDQSIGKVSELNLVSKEADRITGISFDTENSFDNAGSSFDARVAKMIATGRYPDFAYGIPDISGLVKKGVLYRLDEYIEKYAPTVYKLFGPDSKVYGDEWNTQIKNYGGVYSVSMSANHTALRDITEVDKNYDLTPEQVNSVCGLANPPYGSFYVREDILKEIFPNAHTGAELKKIFEKNGTFTKEEIFDVDINSPEEFINFAYKVKDILNKKGEKTAYAMYTHEGSDNWPLLTAFAKVMGYNGNYFSYWDKETKQIKYTFKEDWFKDILKTYNNLVRDDVASKEALIDTSSQFKEKIQTGRYAILLNANFGLPTDIPYRRVWVKYTYNQDKFYNYGSDDSKMMRVSIFNQNLSEYELIMVCRYLEFMASNPGQKLTYWGPKSAGLYTEDENGNLKYTDKELETEMLKGGTGELSRKYGFSGWCAHQGVSASKYRPKAFYTEIKKYGEIYNPATLETFENIKGNAPDIYQNSFTEKVAGAKTFWQARQGFEDAMMKIFTSTNDEMFEKNYSDMIDYAVKYGLTDETLKQCNEFYENEYNKDYMKYLK